MTGKAAINWSRIAGRIRVPLGFVFAAVYLWLARPSWLSLSIGMVIASLGIAVRALASGHVRKNEELTRTGLYARTRNPLYLGSIIIAIGFTIAAQSLGIALLLAVMFVAIYVPVIRSEEAFLASKFPEYAAYASRVPRLLPRLWGRKMSTEEQSLGPKDAAGGTDDPASGFSLALYRKHREYNAVLGAVLILAALMIKVIWRSH